MYNFVVFFSAEATVIVVVVVAFPCDVDTSVAGVVDEVRVTGVVVISFSDDQNPPTTLS